MQKELNVVGARLPMMDAAQKVKGAAPFTDDLVLPGMLYGKILRSPLPHARILNIDTSAAKALPGVRTVITADDIELVPFGFGQDNTALKADKVTCIRDEVAAVAADSPQIAEATSEARIASPAGPNRSRRE